MKKLFPFLIACVFVLSCGFYFFSRNPAAYLHRAYEAVCQEDWISAEKTLEALENEYPTYPLTTLHRGYLAQLKGRFKEADKHFQNVLSRGVPETVLYDLSLAMSLNAFLEGKDDELSLYVNQALETSPFPFFNQPGVLALAHYVKGEYGMALNKWEESLTKENEEGSWFSLTLEQLMPRLWIELHQAHCLAELGRFDQAHKQLDQALQQIQLQGEYPHLEPLANLFLGITSLLEAKKFPLQERGSFYRLAHYYLEQGLHHPGFDRNKNRALTQLALESKQAMEQPELATWVCSFVHLLEQANAQNHLESIAKTVSEKAFDGNPCFQGLYPLFAHEFTSGAFHQELLTSLVFHFEKKMHKGEVASLYEAWDWLSLFTTSQANFSRKFLAQLSDEIHRALHRDGEALSLTQDYISLWQYLEKDTSRRFQFAQSLIGQSEMLWKKEGQEKKALRLMRVALNIVEEEKRHPLARHIEQYLTSLYHDAEEANMVRRLSLIYDALSHFNCADKNLASPSSLANHLADADYLFRSHQYTAAQTYAEWVLKFDGSNHEALRLYGLSSFHLGEYRKATGALEKLQILDAQTSKALILSQALVNQGSENHLAQTETGSD